ncbi:xanthine dehydrogenase small subunit [Breoghania sp. L-A4]|uniref:xanthine dehydrogenase small subunit n=1 Tax=Breoghania sp. L-A4 TaxID=2304600 RepID=UPI000E35B81F|nr:xanthine dehydrogenase small subunit [Breoghania sp. L-A4]AXS40592.1 xanthine dehydrogenase small subunit [Breoghania sp. L-A4]
MRASLRFFRRGETVSLTNVGPAETLLDYLRLREGSCGTKEGCGEGDCGACTVAIGRVQDGVVRYEPVNACIQLLGMIDGCEVVTVDDLARGAGEGMLHPVQDAMLRHHGSQCGFCTPGIVMSLFTLYHDDHGAPDRKAVNDRLAGNLCRCTGYRPIIDAAMEVCFEPADDAWSENAAETLSALGALDDGANLFIGDEDRFFASPADVDALTDLFMAHPDATLVAGATDVGLWITKQLRDLPKVIWLGRVAGLDRVETVEGGLIIGATATYARSHSAIAAIDPDLGELWRRIGSMQVRARGTVGGNIANGSPIGDTPPALIALGATLELRCGSEARTVPLEDFFIDYGKQDLRPGELVTGVFVPKMKPNHRFRAYKLSKRFDQDISAVMGAFRITLEDDGLTIGKARIAYGGMAATPKRAKGAESALIGARLSEPGTWSRALRCIGEEFTPLTDMRASSSYRSETARALLAKALVEIAGMNTARTRITGIREAALDPVA